MKTANTGGVKVNYQEQCFCQSYYDDNNELKDCTCGKCGQIELPKNYHRLNSDLRRWVREINDQTNANTKAINTLRGER